ncbi:MAG: hypothetical protein ACRC78_01985 [Planktothrix sp.]
MGICNWEDIKYSIPITYYPLPITHHPLPMITEKAYSPSVICVTILD